MYNLYSLAYNIWINSSDENLAFGDLDCIYQQLIAIKKGWA